MASRRLDYDAIAPTYDDRYRKAEREGANDVLSLLHGVVRQRGATRVLEVGCGTGYWLAGLHALCREVYGLDLSMEMLLQARARQRASRLVRATAAHLPFAATFDLIFCVNALHHFEDPRGLVAEARRCLRPGGALAVIGMNPHAGRDRWYIYDYFAGTYATDRERYPSPGTITDWMVAEGFGAVESRLAHRILHEFVGRAVLDDPILRKNGTSQLALLSDEAYAAGRRRIDAALERDPKLKFPVDISLFAVVGF